MKSGKTKCLIKEIGRTPSRSRLVVCHKSSKVVSSRCSSTRDIVPDFCVELLSEVDVSDKQHIFIDECQLFPDLSTFVQRYSDRKLYMAGLTRDYANQPFGHLDRFLQNAEVVRCIAICDYSCCVADAQYSKRIVDKHEQFISDKDIYEARCREHYVPKIRYSDDGVDMTWEQIVTADVDQEICLNTKYFTVIENKIF